MATATAKPVTNGHRLVSLAELLELPLPFEDVTLPEMGGVTVRLFAVIGTEVPRLRQIWNASANAPDDEELDLTASCEIIAATLPDSTVEQVRALPGTVIKRLFTPALRLSGLSNEAFQAALDALKTIPSADSGSA